MRALVHSFRQAPARVVANIVAIALAVGAIGIFAVPTVAADSLREDAAADRLAHVGAGTTLIDPSVVDQLDLPELAAIDGRLSAMVDANDQPTRLIGIDTTDQTVDLVAADQGRLPGPGEVLVSDGVAELGEVLVVGGEDLDVVGIGTTTWYAEDDLLVTDHATAEIVTGLAGVNRLAIRVDDPTAEQLDAVVETLRVELAEDDATLTSFPTTVPGGRHPLEDDLTEVSSMIGLLGVVAAIVAAVLLAGTTNTLVAERSREVAVRRALGSRRRPLRRQLRGVAISIAAAGAVLGAVLGVVLSNVVARMVVSRFAGITPEPAIGWVVAGASAGFAVGGAWLVAGRAARTATRRPLAESLRDRDGRPFGQRWSERLAARLPAGGLLGRIALRTTWHRRGRRVSIGLQLAAGVAAMITVASLGTSITAFDEAELGHWRWSTRIAAADPGWAVDAAVVADDPSSEAVLDTDGLLDDWDVTIYGLDPDTAMVDTGVEIGRWLDDPAADEAVVSAGFARHLDLVVGDPITVDTAAGPADLTVVGLHPSRSRDVFTPLEALSAQTGMTADAVWSTTAVDELAESGVDPRAILVEAGDDTVVLVDAVDRLYAEDVAARALIADIFLVIGSVVAVVSLLGVSAAVAVDVHERRHELAALLAIGARRRDVTRLLLAELLPVAALAAAVGAVGGWLGSVGIIGFFESANAVEIGAELAIVAIPLTALAAVGAVTLIAVTGARRAASTPVAVTLRAAA
ncbi:MAG: FtsX-like permease family protein [Actinomycetota bacterium]